MKIAKRFYRKFLPQLGFVQEGPRSWGRTRFSDPTVGRLTLTRNFLADL